MGKDAFNRPWPDTFQDHQPRGSHPNASQVPLPRSTDDVWLAFTCLRYGPLQC